MCTYYIVRNDYRQRRVLSVGRGYCSYIYIIHTAKEIYGDVCGVQW